MLVAAFVFQGKGFGRQADELLELTRYVPVEEYTLEQLGDWTGEALMAGLLDPKVVRVEIAEPGQAPQLIFNRVRDFRDWRRTHGKRFNNRSAAVSRGASSKEPGYSRVSNLS